MSSDVPPLSPFELFLGGFLLLDRRSSLCIVRLVTSSATECRRRMRGGMTSVEASCG